jgi:predicted MFS family arabinose efflux permease
MDRTLRLQVPVFVFTRLVMDTTIRMVYPFLGILCRGLGVEISTLSVALSWRALAGAIGALFASTADRRGRKVVMLFGMFLFIAGVAIVVFWPIYPVFVFSLILTTTSASIFNPVLQAYLGDRITFTRRGLALAMFEMSWALSAIIGLPLVGFIIARGGWLAPFPLFSLLGVISLIVLFWLLPRDALPLKNSTSILNNFKLVLASKVALAGLGITMFTMASHELVSIVFGIWLEDAFGLKIVAMGAASVVIGVAEISGQSLIIVITDHRRAVKFGLSLICLTMFALPLLGRSLSGALLGLFLFYICLEFTFVNLLPLMTEILPSARATLMALAISVESLGRAMIDPLAPLLYAINLWAVSIVVMLFCLVSLFALRWIKGNYL